MSEATATSATHLLRVLKFIEAIPRILFHAGSYKFSIVLTSTVHYDIQLLFKKFDYPFSLTPDCTVHITRVAHNQSHDFARHRWRKVIPYLAHRAIFSKLLTNHFNRIENLFGF